MLLGESGVVILKGLVATYRLRSYEKRLNVVSMLQLAEQVVERCERFAAGDDDDRNGE